MAPRRQRYRVMQRQAAGAAPRPIGVVAMGADAALSMVSAEPDRAAFLGELVERTNALDELDVLAPPPADAPEGAVYTRAVPRGGDDFRRALLDRWRRYYGLELERS